MKTMRLFWVLLAGIAVAGCATDRGSGHLQTWGSPIRTLSNLDCTGANECYVTVKPDFGNHTGTVDPEKVTVKRHKEAKIFWKLPNDQANADKSCYFYSHSGDGVFFKNFADDDGQFKDQGPVEDPQTSKPAPTIAQWYLWYSKNKNQIGREYWYKVVFHCGTDNTPYQIDPVIFNDGD